MPEIQSLMGAAPQSPQPPAPAQQQWQEPLPTPPVRVTVTDVKMPFWSMVVFIFKWALAAIPAMLMLIFIGVAFSVFIAGAMAALVGGIAATAPGAGNGASAKSVQAGSPSDPAVAAYIPKVKVSNVRVSELVLGGHGVFGEIKNTGDKTLKDVKIVIYGLNASGKPVIEDTFYPVNSIRRGGEPLKPGYSREFGGYELDGAPSEWAKKAEVEVIDVTFQ